MRLNKLIYLVATIAASASLADPLAEMSGSWHGSGWARETQKAPKETVRCKITNTYNDGAQILTLEGRCIVPGRRLKISGIISAAEGSDRITGRWSNPTGLVSAPIVGIKRNGIVAFNFSATNPITGRKQSQNVEWRISNDSLRLRSSNRVDPTIMMSDISFGR